MYFASLREILKSAQSADHFSSFITRVGFYVGADVLAEEGEDFARLGVAAESLLGKQHFAVHGKHISALAAGDERKTLDHVLIVAHDFVHHTGGARPVVSGDAVFEGDDVFVHDDMVWRKDAAVKVVGQESFCPTTLTNHLFRVKSNLAVGPVAQLGERYNRTVEAKGSSPFRSIARGFWLRQQKNE